MKYHEEFYENGIKKEWKMKDITLTWEEHNKQLKETIKMYSKDRDEKVDKAEKIIEKYRRIIEWLSDNTDDWDDFCDCGMDGGKHIDRCMTINIRKDVEGIE